MRSSTSTLAGSRDMSWKAMRLTSGAYASMRLLLSRLPLASYIHSTCILGRREPLPALAPLTGGGDFPAAGAGLPAGILKAMTGLRHASHVVRVPWH